MHLAQARTPGTGGPIMYCHYFASELLLLALQIIHSLRLVSTSFLIPVPQFHFATPRAFHKSTSPRAD